MSNIPTATPAPPAPSLNKYLVPAILAIVCSAFSCSCGISGTWLMMRGGKAEGGGPVAAKDANSAWQDLQDRLAKNGMKTSRGPGKRGMWFVPGDGSPASGIDVRNAEDVVTLGGSAYFDPWFLAIDHGTTDAAKREASRIKDIEQRDVFTWGRFLFEGSPEKTAELRKALR